MQEMDYEFESTARISRRGSSAVIELDIAYASDRRGSRARRSTRRHSDAFQRSRNELSELGETLEHLTAEFGKPLTVPVDEDGCPDKPPNLRVFRHPYLMTLCCQHRESMHPASHRHVVVNFRVMRRNAEMYVGYLLSQKGVKRSDLYKAKYLPIWTHCVRIKMRINVKVGVIFHGLKSRLGLTSLEGLIFCVDGFYGLEAYGDAFGSIGAGVCPWMELSGNGSAKSLRLKDADNIYVSVATHGMRQMVQQSKQQSTARRQPMASATSVEQAAAVRSSGSGVQRDRSNSRASNQRRASQ